MHLKKASHDCIPRTYITTDDGDNYVFIYGRWYWLISGVLGKEYMLEDDLNKALKEYYESIKN